MKNRHLLIALLLVVVVNGVILLGVAGNRSGKAEATLTLTERELGYNLNRGRDENSGVALALDANPYAQTWDWFDEQKLADLGFDVAAIKQRNREGRDYRRILPKRGYVVLEYAGDAWLSYQAEQEAKIAELQAIVPADDEQNKQLATQIVQTRSDLQSHSRLFPVDAGADPELLRQRHPERDRCIVVAAELGPEYSRGPGQNLTGQIHRLLLSRLHVPRDLQGPLVSLPPREYVSPYDEPDRVKDWQPHYEVVVSWGSRFEPWIESITLTPEGEFAQEAGH